MAKITQQYLESLSDYEVFVLYEKGRSKTRNLCQHVMFKRYEPLVHKMSWNLKGRIIKGNIKGLTVDNYKSDIYETFIRAMDNIKTCKIPNNKWSFYMGAFGYLNAYNRDTIAHYIKKLKNEVSIDNHDDENETIGFSNINKASIKYEFIEKYNPEESYIKERDKKIFWEAVENCLNSKFNKTQKKIWKARAKFVDGDKLSIPVLCDKLKITSKVYRSELKSMKNIFNNEVDVLSKKYVF